MTDDSEVNIRMQEYIKESIEMFDEDVSIPVVSA